MSARPNPAPTKKADKSDGDINVGDTITYTVEGTIPNTTGYDTHPYVFTDYPGVGLTAKTDTAKVYIADENGKYNDKPLAEGVTVDPANKDVDGAADHDAKFTVAVADVKDYSNRKIKLVYQAEVDESVVGSVTNEATVSPRTAGASPNQAR